MKKMLFTSESVTEGHPDKVCDQISDAILDAIIVKDPSARVACECIIKSGMVLVMGEITTKFYVDIPTIVKDTLIEIGYNDPKTGFDASTCAVLVSLNEQSPDISMGVDLSYEFRNFTDESNLNSVGAGDQGLMFGYASDETPTFMPMPIYLAHKLARRLADVRKGGLINYLYPDGKTQVTIEYHDDVPVRVDSIVISSQHSEEANYETLKSDIINLVIKEIIPENLMDDNTKIFINPTGRFVIGGPVGDSGLTGRKIIVDTYGGFSRHGGGAFSGKDPTKVDRSASYMARYIAKNLVAAGICKKCEVGISYAIGVAHPMSLMIDTFSTAKIEETLIYEIVDRFFDLRPAAIIQELDLQNPIYNQCAKYGHFGRDDINLPWERTDKVALIKDAYNL